MYETFIQYNYMYFSTHGFCEYSISNRVDQKAAMLSFQIQRKSQKCWRCLTPLSTIFQLYCGSQFYWWTKSEYRSKPPVTSHLQTLSHYVVLSTPCLSGVRTHTDCIGSCKSNYHTITTTTTPEMLKPYTCNNSRQWCNAVLTSTNIVSFDKVDIQYQYSAHWLIAISIFFVTSKLIEINLQHILWFVSFNWTS